MSIKVLLAEDHAIVREGIHSLIEKQLDMQVVGEARDGLESVELTRRHKPDVVVMDVTMPNMNGIEAAAKIRDEVPEVKILALSVHDDREFVMDMVKAGVAGYLLKDCLVAELVSAIRTVAAGKSYLSPKIAAIVLDEHSTEQAGTLAKVVLKESEVEVLKLLADGKSAKEIAEGKNANIKTIEAKRRRIMEKLGIDNLADLVKYAIREGLTSY